jgi:hypothetical protein
VEEERTVWRTLYLAIELLTTGTCSFPAIFFHSLDNGCSEYDSCSVPAHPILDEPNVVPPLTLWLPAEEWIRGNFIIQVSLFAKRRRPDCVGETAFSVRPSAQLSIIIG